MMSNVDGITKILTIVLGIMVAILVVLVFVLFMIWVKNRLNKRMEKVQKAELSDDKDKNNNKKSNVKTYKEYTKNSIFDFMNFIKIEDNMIIQDKGRYLMIIECQGINYDLMSEMEKVSVEQGFIQFLNTLRFPIQLYIQTRTVNLQSSINGYNEKLKAIESKYRMMQMQYTDMQKRGTYTTKQMQEVYYNILKQKNLYEYTQDIIRDIDRMNLNHNVLNKKYYIVVAYDEPEAENEKYTPEEIQSMAFSELYTRSQSIIRSVMTCEITSKILTSEEIAELLYNAYNREESDVMSVQKALQSGYAELYSTAPDVLDKKMQILNQEINRRANELATQTVNNVKSKKEEQIEETEDNIDDLILDLAQDLIRKNARYIGSDVAEDAIKELQPDKENPEGGKDNEEEKVVTTRRRGRPRKN